MEDSCRRCAVGTVARVRSARKSEVDGAQRELDYLLDNDAKVALIKHPFWRDLESAGPPIALHAGYRPLDDYVAKWEPLHTVNFMAQSAFRWMVVGHRDIADMITSLICHGTLTRFPKLRGGSSHCSTTPWATTPAGSWAASGKPDPKAVNPA